MGQALFSLLFVLGLTALLPAHAHAEAATDSRARACLEGFRRQLAEVIWLRDLDPQSEVPDSAPPLAATPESTRFSLAVVIGDLLQLREQAGTTSWPVALRGLTTQELRRRRDQPEVDGTACEIVRFMHAHYSAERERALPHPIHRTDVGRAPSAELAPASARAAVAPPAVSPAPPAPTPTPVPAPRVPAREPSAPAPVPVERPAAPAAVPSPPQEQPRPVETGERPPLPEPERAAPTETLVSALDAREPQRTPAIEVPGEPSPEPAPLEDPAQPPSDVGQSANSPGLQATARAALARLEKQLAAPRYLTRRVLRRDSASRSDEDVWRSRRTTLDARVRLVELLRELAGTPERHLAVKALLGRQGCARLEERIEELFQGGPESDGISTALMLWRRQPNPR